MFVNRATLLLSAAFVLGSAQGALAADLYGGGMKDAPYVEAMPAAAPSGWYLRVDGSYGAYNDPSVFIEGYGDAGEVSMDDAWSVGGGFGRYFGRGFRGDLTVERRFDSEVYAAAYGDCCSADATVDFKSTVFLANLYYDFNRGGRITPYIGAGLGFAHNETAEGQFNFNCGCQSGDGAILKGSQNEFAWALMAGLSIRLRGGEPTYVGGGMKDEPVAVSSGRALHLDVGYRYIDLGDIQTGDIVLDTGPVDPQISDLKAHEIRVGLRYDLN